MSAARLGVTLAWQGKGVEERGIVQAVTGDAAPALKPGQVIVQIDPRYFRPTEVETLLGDPSRAKQRLGWEPTITFDQMVDEMVSHDLAQARQNSLLRQHGYAVRISGEG